jgi:hypothetical protein
MNAPTGGSLQVEKIAVVKKIPQRLLNHSPGDARVFAQVLRTWLLHGFLIRNGISLQRDLLRTNASSGPISVTDARLLVVKLLQVRHSAGHPEADKELDEEGYNGDAYDQQRQI